MVRLSYEQLGDIARSEPVRRALREKAKPIAARARRIAASEGVDVEVSVSDGTRPKGRPYSRVSMTPGDVEHGTAYTERRRILGRSLQ